VPRRAKPSAAEFTVIFEGLADESQCPAGRSLPQQAQNDKTMKNLRFWAVSVPRRAKPSAADQNLLANLEHLSPRRLSAPQGEAFRSRIKRVEKTLSGSVSQCPAGRSLPQQLYLH